MKMEPQPPAVASCDECGWEGMANEMVTVSTTEHDDGAVTGDVGCPECEAVIVEEQLFSEPDMLTADDAEVVWDVIQNASLVDVYTCWEFRGLTIQKVKKDDTETHDRVLVLGTGKKRDPEFNVSTYSPTELWNKLTNLADE